MLYYISIDISIYNIERWGFCIFLQWGCYEGWDTSSILLLAQNHAADKGGGHGSPHYMIKLTANMLYE